MVASSSTVIVVCTARPACVFTSTMRVTVTVTVTVIFMATPVVVVIVISCHLVQVECTKIHKL